jgi:hypothetical protein
MTNLYSNISPEICLETLDTKGAQSSINKQGLYGCMSIGLTKKTLPILITYSFQEKVNIIQELDAIIPGQGEEVLDYIISIFDHQRKETVLLWSSLLQAVIGKPYAKVKNKLIELGVMSVVTRPIQNVQSTGYKLNISRKGEKNKKSNKYLGILLDESKNFKTKGLNECRRQMASNYALWLKSVTLEVTSEELDELGPSQRKNVINIQNGVVYSSFDKFSGRFHTNISLLKKELRSRIKIDGEATSEVDMCCSHLQQIYHLGYAFNLDANLKKAIQGGDPYSTIAYHLGIDRKKAKDVFAQTINSKKDGWESKKLLSLFPNFFKEVKRFKSIFGDKFMAKCLQMSEMKAVMNISEELALLGIKHFTIHDGFLVKNSQAKKVKQILLKHNIKSKIK